MTHIQSFFAELPYEQKEIFGTQHDCVCPPSYPHFDVEKLGTPDSGNYLCRVTAPSDSTPMASYSALALTVENIPAAKLTTYGITDVNTQIGVLAGQGDDGLVGD